MTHLTPDDFISLLKFAYAFCATVLFLYGLSNLSLSVIYTANRRKINARSAPPPPQQWPRVTIQLPVYNERSVVERLLTSAAALDYPRDRLQIQVLDDSTDGYTSDLLKGIVERLQREGLNIQYLHRKDRRGYKAGNLASGMPHASGELIAIFDADFIIPPGWLKQVAPVFQDPKIGFVQTRWLHMNYKSSFLARMISLAMDGHFVVEQGARSFAGLPMAFNGSAGMWRRAAIEQAGGWHWDTLAEDLDLSYRAQIHGWRGTYLPNVTALNEVPETMNAFMIQQFRWAKGSVQVTRKLALKWWRSRLPLYKRIFGLVHMTMYLPFPFMLLLLLLALPLGLYAAAFFVYFPWTGLVTIGPPLMYALARTENMPRLRDRIYLIQPLLLVGIGITVECALGVISGLLFKGGVFKVTPKSTSLQPGRPGAHRAPITVPPGVAGELAMGVYLLTAAYALSPILGGVVAPWLLSSAAGFLMVFLLSFYRGRSRKTEQRPEQKNRRLFGK